ncbi:helix-turn-helix transcriptional regulator [Brevundimonas sp. Leaf363]|uniref:helix-turn-helix domain-containing protein n=1 Tax=Brevundimonas sp. Leaf363 TaxID=1736353 RepID=UPI00138F3137
MASPPFPNHVRAWRLFRHMTQEELAEAIGSSTATVGHIETGARRLTDKWAHPIAKALSTSAGYLLDHDPNDLPTAVLDVWAEIPVESRDQALKVLESFKRTGTQG